MGRLAAIGLLGMFALSRAAFAEGDPAVAGVVHDAQGKPVSGIEVALEIGRARYALTEGFDRYESARTDRANADQAGGFRFENVPEGASLLVWAKSADGFASSAGVPNVTLKLAPLGTVSGKLAGKPAHLKGLRVGASGAFVPWTQGKVDEDAGTFEVGGLVPGEGVLHVYRGNFEVARAPVAVSSGEETKVKPVRVPDGFLPVADPLVDVLKVRLVDSRGQPVSGVQLVWSSQWMDGGMNSDAEGIVRLAGGGVAIGGPPYLLRLSSLRQGTNVMAGVVKGGKGGTATVELQSLVEVGGTVSLGGKALELYRLFVVTDGKSPRVRTATVEKGRYSVHLLEGTHRVVVGTVDGALHETTIQVATSGTPQTRDIALP